MTTGKNTVNREPQKARYDVATIRSIIQQAHFVNVAFVDLDGNPQSIPMICAVFESEDGLTLYLHGYHKARLVKLLPPESRVCVSATLLDGIGLALSAFHHTMNHRSAVLHGVVEDWDETTPDAAAAKWDAARQIVDAVVPGRWAHCREPNGAEMTSTGFLKVRVLSASAKVRSGQPGEERKDVLDKELVGKTWAGIIPNFNVAPLPEHIAAYIADANVAPGN
ncbi:hypothetical protein Q8F55_002403 [Vanrija albida]|uniref:Pyridoxamine 5'-phosphate oxidase putative domain-containing protein n=1 Tax=Vanrija albida TaxID=181172 RepID=A0ABR3Q9W5_9TREE